jgi:hypothetical protein
MIHTHQTAPTQFVGANGIRFAYRGFGKLGGVPLVFMQHFRGGMDHSDPAVTDGFTEHRPVILFDNAGVAASTGESTAGGYHQVASTSWRTFCGTQGHQTADPCRERPPRHHGPDHQPLHAIPEHPKRPIDHLSRCRPWRVIPGSGALRAARRDASGRMTFHDVGLHQYTGREIEGVATHDRSP